MSANPPVAAVRRRPDPAASPAPATATAADAPERLSALHAYNALALMFDLPDTERIVLMILLHHAREANRVVYPGQALIGAMAARKSERVRLALAGLAKRGLIRLVRKGGGVVAARYHVDFEAIVAAGQRGDDALCEKFPQRAERRDARRSRSEGRAAAPPVTQTTERTAPQVGAKVGVGDAVEDASAPTKPPPTPLARKGGVPPVGGYEARLKRDSSYLEGSGSFPGCETRADADEGRSPAAKKNGAPLAANSGCADPVPDAACFNCRGRRWWEGRAGSSLGRGWRCCTCHPPPPGSDVLVQGSSP